MSDWKSGWHWLLACIQPGLPRSLIRGDSDQRTRCFRPSPEVLEERSLLTVLVSVIALDPIVEEGNEASFMITADDPYVSVTVGFRTVAGSAIENTDYTGVNDSRTFTGSTTVSVTTLHDFIYETYETFSLELTSAIGAEIDPESEVAETTIDDDTAIVSDVRALEGIKNPDRIVTNATLELIQDDVVTFRAEPPGGGTLDEDDVVWKVTGQPDVTGTARTVAFTEFMDFVAVCAQTPNASSVACVTVELVPHPTGIENTHDALYTNPIGGPIYQGRDFIHDLVPSEGATGQSLFDAYQSGELAIKEYTVVASDSITNLTPGQPPPGSGQSSFGIVSDGTVASLENDKVAVLLTALDVNNFTQGNTVFPELPRETAFAQDFLWKGTAADSVRDGQWNEFVQDNPISMKLRTEGHTFVFDVTDNGLNYVEFYNGPPLLTQFHVPATVNSTTPGTVRMIGGFWVPFGAPPPTMIQLTLRDSDGGWGADDELTSVQKELLIPAGIPGSPSVWFNETTQLWAEWAYLPVPGYVVRGGTGSSGEEEAEVYFEVVDDIGAIVVGPSPTKSVLAVQ